MRRFEKPTRSGSNLWASMVTSNGPAKINEVIRISGQSQPSGLTRWPHALVPPADIGSAVRGPNEGLRATRAEPDGS